MLKIKENIPLAPLTTFKIGGSARYFVDVSSEKGIRESIQWARGRGVRHILLAGGSNVLIPDEGLDALIIKVNSLQFTVYSNTLEADAGCNLLTLIREAGKKGLGGWEKLAGIPGTIGGAVRGNAGAFGPEIKDFLVSVRALNTDTGETRELENKECQFAYRMSFFKKHPEWLITSVRLALSSIDAAESKRIQEETIAEREKRHIQNVRAAGSFFINPVATREIQEMFEREKGAESREGRVPAGWLLEKAGLKGARVGSAVASEQQPNYLKNEGHATAKEVLALAEKIKEAVRKQFGIELREEAVILK